ncbi:MAG: GGDEF domain-containing protein [Phycisphaeraceae bacterium]|nr:GGDEF domain-containing protein [Phycisphaeraceae bacterium]
MSTRQDDSWNDGANGRGADGVRVVLVGASELERPLRRVPGMELIRAREPLGALGEVGNPIDAESPLSTVVVVAPGAVTAERAENFAAGVRRIDGAARVLNIGTYALRGFDAALPETAEDLAPLDLLSRLTGIEQSRRIESADTVDIDADPATVSEEVPPIGESPSEECEESAAATMPEETAAPTETEPSALATSLNGHEPGHVEEPVSEDRSSLGLAPEPDEAASPPSTHYSAFEATEGIAAAAKAEEPLHGSTPDEAVAVVESAEAAHAEAPAGAARDTPTDSVVREELSPSPAAAPGGPADAERVVQALLHGQDPIEAVMAPLRERIGVPNAAFVPAREGEDIMPPTGGVPVRFGDRTLGHLVAPRVPRDVVEAEAAQLGVWIALSTQHQQLKAAAFADELTGAWNRRYFARFLSAALEKGRALRRPVTLLYFDIDDFKVYNDKYGHAAGDEILVEVVKLLRSVIRPTDRVCRVGGDEFVVVFFDPDGPRDRSKEQAPDDIMPIARRFQQQVCEHRFPKLAEEARGTLTVSGGMASFPWDGHDVQTLLDRADELALQSKRAGKNAITLGPGAELVCRAI